MLFIVIAPGHRVYPLRGTIALRWFRLVLCFAGLITYLWLRHLLAPEAARPERRVPDGQREHSAEDGKDLELLRETDQPV